MRSFAGRSERGEAERREKLRQAELLAEARRRGEYDGLRLALTTERIDVPSFETIIELETYFGGCYAGYRGEVGGLTLTFEEFMRELQARGTMEL